MSYKCYRNNEKPEDAISSENADKFGCPACEYMQNNKLITCTKFIGISGKDPQKDAEYTETFKCTENWMPILMIENSKQGLSTTVAVESMRNITSDSFSAINANLKNSMEAMANSNVMQKLENKVRDVTPVPVAAINSSAGSISLDQDIYGNGMGDK